MSRLVVWDFWFADLDVFGRNVVIALLGVFYGVC